MQGRVAVHVASFHVAPLSSASTQTQLPCMHITTRADWRSSVCRYRLWFGLDFLLPTALARKDKKAVQSHRLPRDATTKVNKQPAATPPPKITW